MAAAYRENPSDNRLPGLAPELRLKLNEDDTLIVEVPTLWFYNNLAQALGWLCGIVLGPAIMVSLWVMLFSARGPPDKTATALLAHPYRIAPLQRN